MGKVKQFLELADEILGSSSVGFLFSVIKAVAPKVYRDLTPEEKASLDENVATLIAEKTIVDAEIAADQATRLDG